MRAMHHRPIIKNIKENLFQCMELGWVCKLSQYVYIYSSLFDECTLIKLQ
jgi:hypothetical protein